ncbi:MAG: polyribonucleotide nucleotidyltransferase [Candidatus Sericytochromatia bacterium]|nr:polyribonucleotide nucleotidyltransferase [Candidatus Sericytochromatia bacterium]
MTGPQAHVFKTNLGDKELVIEIGKLAKQANCAVTVQCGGTMVLVAVTASRSPREGIDFFPLLVDVEQKMYAVGRIPGSFMRREGRASESAILNSRLIDRGIRPLFPDGYRNDVQVTATILSSDKENQPDVLGILGAGIALTLSDIPFAGPFAGVRVGRVAGKWVLNPTYTQDADSDMDLVVAGTQDAVMMVEAGMNEVPEAEVLDALELAHSAIRKLCEWTIKMQGVVGKPKQDVQIVALPAELSKYVQKAGAKRMTEAMSNPDKLARQSSVDDLKKVLVEEMMALPETDAVGQLVQASPKDAKKAVEHLEEDVFRKLVTEKGLRVDGRRLDEIRPMYVETNLVPRAHGSGLFQRGQTQVCTILTLGSPGDAQKIDTIDPEVTRRYMHHYNFPAYSVGEVRPNRGPGRREIGHGALAERALKPVLPDAAEFPYTIRLVSEVLESNGSSSMASTCGSTLAMLDGGVPLKRPVAGVAMGLIKEGERFAILTDIQGIEDHLGDMDFKVTGTHAGITALQMDIKITGIELEVMQVALEQARKGRLEILDVMNAAIAQPAEMSPYAPRMATIKINPEYIGTLIGPGGKNIRKITEETQAKIDIDDTGLVTIMSSEPASMLKARQWVEKHTREVEPGGIYLGKVVRILNFGAFVELFPGKDGLVHISQLAAHRVAKVEDEVNIGDEIVVKVVEIDPQGRVNLTRKGVTPEEAATVQLQV